MKRNIKKIKLFLVPLLYVNLMAQQNFKIVETNYNLKDADLIRKDLQNYEFYSQNVNTHKTCTKHREKSEFRIMADDNNKFVLIFDDEENAMNFLNSSSIIDYGLLETDFQEEIERITPDNIEEKSKSFLKRFNDNFKLTVDYNPNEDDIANINERVKKTIWNKENRFLLNFYMMEVTKRRFNFTDWKFEKINTFNPFYVPQYVGRNASVNSYYSNLDPKTRKYFDFKLYLGL